jgi:hypothetical protein
MSSEFADLWYVDDDVWDWDWVQLERWWSVRVA